MEKARNLVEMEEKLGGEREEIQWKSVDRQMGEAAVVTQVTGVMGVMEVMGWGLWTEKELGKETEEEGGEENLADGLERKQVDTEGSARSP